MIYEANLAGLPASDPFCQHFEVNLSDEDVEKLRTKGSGSTSQNSVSRSVRLGRFT